MLKLSEKLEFEFNNTIITLIRGKRISYGRNNLKDIKWHVYKFDDKAREYFGNEYDGVAVMFTKITMDVLDEIEKGKRVYQTGVSTADRANADMNTGNIHPPKPDKPNYDEIRQLVLFNDRGPLTPHFVETRNYYFYSAVHKACYYPTINDKDMSKYEDDKRRIFLKAVWKALGL